MAVLVIGMYFSPGYTKLLKIMFGILKRLQKCSICTKSIDFINWKYWTKGSAHNIMFIFFWTSWNKLSLTQNLQCTQRTTFWWVIKFTLYFINHYCITLLSHLLDQLNSSLPYLSLSLWHNIKENNKYSTSFVAYFNVFQYHPY